MKICVAVSLFSRTGVPLAQLRFARALAERGHEVDFIVGGIDARYPDTPYPECAGVTVIAFGQTKVRNMFFPICSYLAAAKPDVVFSAEDHFNGVFLLAAIATRSRSKISGSSRVPPSDSYSNAIFSKRWFKKQLLRAVMWRADALTCVSYDMVDDYRTFFRQSQHVGVHNIIVDELSKASSLEPAEHPWFAGRDFPLVIAAGTLTTRKGFADLIEAMGLVPRQRGFRLLILGEGPLRPELQEQIDTLGLADCVRLHGLVENPLKYFACADVFALSSYAEGLPNVLVEAMMCGCTPVATDCRTGPREVIGNDKFGYLVPVGDPEAMARAIESAIDQPVSRERLCQAIESFSADAVVARHFELLGLQTSGGHEVRADGCIKTF